MPSDCGRPITNSQSCVRTENLKTRKNVSISTSLVAQVHTNFNAASSFFDFITVTVTHASLALMHHCTMSFVRVSSLLA